MKKIQAEINKEDKDLIEKLLSAGIYNINTRYAYRQYFYAPMAKAQAK